MSEKYFRITNTVKDRGTLVPENMVMSSVTDKTTDWYSSAFFYEEDGLSYWNNNNNSMKGFKGKVFSHALFFDLDCEHDLDISLDAARKLVDYLYKEGYWDSVEVYFSGNKGFHVYLACEQKLDNKQTEELCCRIANSVGLKPDVFDSVVYNSNRIFRIANTRHAKSGLYKIAIDGDELFSLSIEEIKILAKAPRDVKFDTKSADISGMIKKLSNVSSIKDFKKELNVVDIKSVDADDFDENKCPPEKRRCIFLIENGRFGPGIRHECLLAITAYYKMVEHLDKDSSYQRISEALSKRELVYPEVNDRDESDILHILEDVYSDSWGGGIPSCSSNDVLRSLCDRGKGPCCYERKPKSIISIDELFDFYDKEGLLAEDNYPKTGIEWIDDRVRLRYGNISIINGANGSGKTSIAIQFMENLNSQKIPHAFFSLDMPHTSFFEKLASRYTEYSAKQIEGAFNKFTRNNEIINSVKKEVSKKFPYTFFDFSSALSVQDIESTIIGLRKSSLPIKVAIIDYAGRILGDKGNSLDNAEKNAHSLLDLCKNLKIHVMVLSQISREHGDHTRELRTSRIAKHSGAWEDNATAIMNCWRPFGDGIDDDDNFIHIYVAKNRSGKLGERIFGWDGKTGFIYELSDEEFKYYIDICRAKKKPLPSSKFYDKSSDHSKPKTKIHIEEDIDEELHHSKRFENLERNAR